ncbi:hypothetical protein [Microbacterium maritypicum]
MKLPKHAVRDMILGSIGLPLIIFGVHAIASIPDLGVALLIAALVAIAIIAAERLIASGTSR